MSTVHSEVGVLNSGTVGVSGITGTGTGTGTSTTGGGGEGEGDVTRRGGGGDGRGDYCRARSALAITAKNATRE